jgi:hypothetical protein
VFFTGMTAFSTSAYSIGIPSMMADLGMTDLQALAGVGLYAFVRVHGVRLGSLLRYRGGVSPC